MIDSSLCGNGAVILIESVGDNLGDVVGVCNVICVGCWWEWENVAGVKIE